MNNFSLLLYIYIYTCPRHKMKMLTCPWQILALLRTKRSDNKTARMRASHWAFSSLHIPCDSVPLGEKLVLHSVTKVFRWHKPEGTVGMSVQNTAPTDSTHSINCTLSVTDFPPSILLSEWRSGSLSPSSPIEESVYSNNPPPSLGPWSVDHRRWKGLGK